MAKIPLTDIPNAPGIGDPTLAPNLPHSPGRIPLDVSGEQLNGQGLAQTDNLLTTMRRGLDRSTSQYRSALESTQSPLRNDHGQQAIDESLGFGGRALAKSGEVIGDYANSMALARDADTVSKASILMHQGFAEHANAIANGQIQPADYVTTWQNDKLPEIKARIAGLDPSPRIQQRLSNDVAQFGSTSSMQLNAAATKQVIGGMGQTALAAAQLDFDSGNLAGAYNHLQEAVNAGIVTTSQRDTRWQSMTAEANLRQAVSMSQQYPEESIENIRDLRSGKVARGSRDDHFPSLDDAQLSTIDFLARAKFRQLQVGTAQSIDQGITAGTITKEAQIREQASRESLPETTIQSFVRSLQPGIDQSTPQGQAAYKVALNRLDSATAQYAPGADPDDSRYHALAAGIRESLYGPDRQPMLDQLAKRHQDGVDPASVALLETLATADQLQSRGMINSAGLDTGGNVVPGQESQAMQSATAQIALKSQIRGLFQDHPQLTLPQANDALVGMIGSRVTAATSADIRAYHWLPHFSNAVPADPSANEQD